MRLLHHSQEPFYGPVESRKQPIPKTASQKPVGFWVSVEGDQDWKHFCLNDAEWPDRIQKTSEILLTPNANILYLSSASELREFTQKFSIETIIGKGIDWQRVASLYDGIIIAPYIWECRLELDTFWYYGWDCASGCIWNADAIASVISETEKA